MFYINRVLKFKYQPSHLKVNVTTCNYLEKKVGGPKYLGTTAYCISCKRTSPFLQAVAVK